METDESPTSDRDARRSTGHHVMVASTVVRLVVMYGSNDRILVRNLGQLRQVLANTYARNIGFDGPKLASNLSGSFWFRIECFEMGRTAIHPNQDAVTLRFGPTFGLAS